ncbi:3-deoxy-manno-octulosonate cytidylyltransferase [Marinibactrum halimedae]|uniref:3-deoxy-manno-octulosonate cytidylyltransferase n=1 Tax=Marinibactrum halimedae TaxID=1444977 RepID=A0AA37WMJ8_9GAMM|nr:3-deoxy-manno-octulosonate cytidylyltransferase [Marinibactrum halimedae]MCD9460050.1 3-deoxy-manno-octulosonate cytidylyltransferase [Marinibactrum halimedae]GLS26448.1 3-deoxy-manno-octulosonate cytidylyltransferase [Marinibactrum halimedae]
MNTPEFYVVIPARYASTRLPGKPLCDIAGKPMIQRVYERAVESGAKRLVVATDDERIKSVVESFGGEVCMTSPEHESGTDRLQEVVSRLSLTEESIVVNVQGDEPLIPPEVIRQVAVNLAKTPEASVATLSEPITELASFLDPNVVKVVSNASGLACYFSRAPIPWPREDFASEVSLPFNTNNRVISEMPEGVSASRHIGIYAYRVALLNRFVQWPQAALETTEKLEQLRVLANGESIHVAPACEEVPGGVDTPEDLERLRQLLGEK